MTARGIARAQPWVFVLAVALAAAGCSSSDANTPAPTPDTGATPSADTGSTGTTPDKGSASGAKRVKLVTSMGEITIELDAVKAPKSVANFLAYVGDKFYDGTLFHRVISNFMIQGGGYDGTLKRKTTKTAITNEADNGLKNVRGSIAMARTSAPHSATAQFFINVVDNTFLNHTAKTSRGWGYAVFGKVTAGLDVVDKIKAVPTGAKGPFTKDAPKTNVVIQTARVVQ